MLAARTSRVQASTDTTLPLRVGHLPVRFASPEEPTSTMPSALSDAAPDIQAVAAQVRTIAAALDARPPLLRTIDTENVEYRFLVDDRVRKVVRVRSTADARYAAEFYFDVDGRLIFVLESERQLVPSRAASAQLSRYYFVDGVLRRWVRVDGALVPEADMMFTMAEQRLLQEAADLTAVPPG
jgi:hypothetical protein